MIPTRIFPCRLLLPRLLAFSLLAIIIKDATAQDIIHDEFTATPGYYVQMPSRFPTTANLPGGVWLHASGDGAYETFVKGSDYVPNGTSFPGAAAWHNVASSGHSLANFGSYVKPSQLRISADLAFGASTNQYILLGFYSSLAGGGTYNPMAGFTGLRLNINGSLTLVQNGSVGSAIAWTGGTFDPLVFKKLTYEVNTTTGVVSNITLVGSSSSYAFTSSAFTNAATAYCGSGGVAGTSQGNIARDSVYVDNFKVSVAGAPVPTPTPTPGVTPTPTPGPTPTPTPSPTPTPTPTPTPISQSVIHDEFTASSAGYNVEISSRVPTTANRPTGNWLLATGAGQYEAVVRGSSYSPSGTLFPGAGQWHNTASSAHTLASQGTYTKPTAMSVSADLAFGATSNQYLLLGFYSGLPGTTNPMTSFTGLRLNVNGSLALVQNGTLGTSTNWTGGTFDPLSMRNLSYNIDTNTGAISNVILAGSSSSYSFSSTAFLNSATAYVGAGGVAGTARGIIGQDSVYADNLKITAFTSGTSGDQDGDGMPDSWELANGLNPGSASDANLDADGDGQTNLAEYGWGTNPNSFNTAGTITASVITPQAYELGTTSARIRFSRTGGTVPTSINFAVSGRASASDYQLKLTNGTAVNTSVALGFLANEIEVVVEPVVDSTNEYPETMSVTLASSPYYTQGSPSMATVTINDAADIQQNEKLFVAMLTPSPGTNSQASGIATILLNGPKNLAKVSVTFNGLTSGQTNAYIRYGVSSGVGPEMRPNLGIGQLTDVVWNIVPVTPYSGQQIIDALYRVNGAFLYTNIGTGNFPGGEIQGTWNIQTGTPTFTAPAAPPAVTALTGDALTRDVARFLTAATFGPTKAEIDALVSRITTNHGGDRIAGFNAWIDEQLGYDQTNLLDYTRASNEELWVYEGINPYTTTTFSSGTEGGRFGWLTMTQKARDQLRLRFAFALSEIFVVSSQLEVILGDEYSYTHYHDMLGSYATGTYRNLLESVSKHPTMGYYLSSLKNQKAIVDANGKILISPDENYAREIMQLFSIGLVQRHPDGSLKLGSNGLPLATYGYSDIANLSRVFTGWSFSKNIGSQASGYPVIDNNDFNASLGTIGHRYFQVPWIYPMKSFASYHDTGAKTLLGSNIPAGLDGEADLDAALNIIANHPNVAPFLSRLLIQRFTTSNPSSGYLYRVAQKFENNGSGVRGDMKAVIKAILLDYEARSLDLTANIGFGKQKEPLIRLLQVIRAFDGKSNLPLSRISAYLPAAQTDNYPPSSSQYRMWHHILNPSIGQLAMHAPSVFNWFLPDYRPGGAISSAGLYAPEMQITTESSTFKVINYNQTLVYDGLDGQHMQGVTDHTLEDVKLNFSLLSSIYDAEIAAGRTTVEATTKVLDHLDIVLMSGNLKSKYGTAPTPNPRSILVSAVSGMSLSATSDRMKELLYLVITTPEFVHQK